MPHFNFDQAVGSFFQGAAAIAGNFCFTFGLYGLSVAALAGAAGCVLLLRSSKYALALLIAAAKVALCCALLAAPGSVILIVKHALPSMGSLNISPVAYVIFWSWICLHFLAEEMNFKLF